MFIIMKKKRRCSDVLVWKLQIEKDLTARNYIFLFLELKNNQTIENILDYFSFLDSIDIKIFFSDQINNSIPTAVKN